MKGQDSFTFNPNTENYTVKMKKQNWWWLLLLLIPLILLIPFSRTIEYQIIDASTKTELLDVNTEINFISPVLNEETSLTELSDNKGKTTFVIERKPLYKILFFKVEDFSFESKFEAEGYCSLQTTDNYVNAKNQLNVIELSKAANITFLLIDSISGKPLSDIEVEVLLQNETTFYKSDNKGIVNLPSTCFQLNDTMKISARHNDYENKVVRYIIDNKYIGKDFSDTLALLSVKDGGLRGERGALSINLKWNTTDDLDIHILTPCGEHIYFEVVESFCDSVVGKLDIDANAEPPLISDPQENVFWNEIAKGEYTIRVHFYQNNSRTTVVPFIVTIINNSQRTELKGEAKRESEYYLDYKFTVQ